MDPHLPCIPVASKILVHGTFFHGRLAIKNKIILLLPRNQEGQLSVTGERMCTKHYKPLRNPIHEKCVNVNWPRPKWPKAYWGPCTEVPSYNITNEQILISWLFLFFIPHNVIRTIWQNYVCACVTEIWLCLKKCFFFFPQHMCLAVPQWISSWVYSPDTLAYALPQKWHTPDLSFKLILKLILSKLTWKENKMANK